MTNESTDSKDPRPTMGAPRRPGRRIALAVALVAVGAAGAGAGALAQRTRTVTYLALAPAPITSMRDGASVAVEGDVAETFGNKFVLHDGSGRALVETGRSGEGRRLVAPDEKVTVQGRFERGFIHAIAIRHVDGRTDMLDPPPPHARPGLEPADEHGPR